MTPKKTSGAIHSNQSLQSILKVLNELSAGQIRHLEVATDLDFDNLESPKARILGALPSVMELKSQGIKTWPKDGVVSPSGITFGFLNSQPMWLLHPREILALKSDPELELNGYGLYREIAGEFFRAWEATGAPVIVGIGPDVASDAILGFLVGLELGAYRFKTAGLNDGKKSIFHKFTVVHRDKKKINELRLQAIAIAGATNIARHLVNLPGSVLNPETFANLAEKFFSGHGNLKVTTWDPKELAQQECRLILAVGNSAQAKPRLTRLSYRPTVRKSTQAPIAFIGKGVTFDSGGLDIKPSSGMRLMKKDMAGAAAMFGFAHWLAKSKVSHPIELLMPLAENAISESSMRPGDVIVAKGGISVEIHNTDAEGRLVLADAISVAKELKCEAIVDVATLTGAIKVALGGDVSGLFSNAIDLRARLAKASAQAGEATWPMPLVQSYRTKMKSSFADMQNAVDGFGGAVTAALFLQSFVGTTPWAHLDIYGWADAPQGSLSEIGGTGQAVQTLVQFVSQST